MRPALLILAALPTLAEEAQTRCQMVGAVFGTDPFGSTLLLKDSRGYIKTLNLPAGTKFLKIPVTAGGTASPMTPGEINTGDLVCVQKENQISILPRNDVHRAQREFLVQWQRDGIYGTVVSTDVAAKMLTVRPSPDGEPVRVTLPENVRLRAALPEARRRADSRPFQLAELKSGESVYVRGKRTSDRELTAELVLKGGYRAILGTLVEVKVLDSALQIQEFGTGRSLLMKMTPGELYRTTENLTDPMRVETQSGVVLTPVGFADLQTGDAILIVGKADGGSGDGLFAVTRFGTFGVLPQDPEKRISWFLTR